jgi:hypothetical protein
MVPQKVMKFKWQKYQIIEFKQRQMVSAFDFSAHAINMGWVYHSRGKLLSRYPDTLTNNAFVASLDRAFRKRMFHAAVNLRIGMGNPIARF